MARARSPNRDKAFELYKEHNGEITLREIAKKLNTPEKTISGWKAKDKWHNKLNGVLQTKIRSTPKEKKDIKKRDKEPIAEEVKEVLENTELTDKQRLFCHYYLRSFNQTMAAIKAGYSPERAHVTGSELVRNSKVKEEIKRLKGKMTEELFIDAMDVLRKYVEIAFSDINDFVQYGKKEITIDKDEDGNEIKALVNYVDFKDSYMVDGTLIEEVSQGKNGVKIKLYDKMKALEKLEKYFDLLPDNFKRKIEEEKVKMAREKLELEKSKVNGDETEVEDDGFLEALKGRTAEVWKNE